MPLTGTPSGGSSTRWSPSQTSRCRRPGRSRGRTSAFRRTASTARLHHPLFLEGARVAATDPNGAPAHRLRPTVRPVHRDTSDALAGGVSEALALGLGLRRPAAADARSTSSSCSSRSTPPSRCAPRWPRPAPGGSATTTRRRSPRRARDGSGRSRAPRPAIGEVGRRRGRRRGAHRDGLPDGELRGHVVAAMRAAHPYEEPAYDVIELAALDEPRPAARAGSAACPSR